MRDWDAGYQFSFSRDILFTDSGALLLADRFFFGALSFVPLIDRMEVHVPRSSALRLNGGPYSLRPRTFLSGFPMGVLDYDEMSTPTVHPRPLPKPICQVPTLFAELYICLYSCPFSVSTKLAINRNRPDRGQAIHVMNREDSWQSSSKRWQSKSSRALTCGRRARSCLPPEPPLHINHLCLFIMVPLSLLYSGHAGVARMHTTEYFLRWEGSNQWMTW